MDGVPGSPARQPAPDRTGRWQRLAARVAAVALFAAGAALLLRYEAQQPTFQRGDGWEYAYQAESIRRHHSLDLWPEDVETVNGEGLRRGLWAAPDPPHAYATAPNGRRYGVHFWAYGLSAAPAREYLMRTGGDPLGGLRLANTAWLILAVAVTLFASSAPVGERLALAGLAAAGPTLWYIGWTGAELFSWALALIAVVTYRDRRYGWAGAAAGLAATQNPPLVFLGCVAVLAAAWERRWWAAAASVAGTAISLAPFAFFQYHFGKPNLIAAESATLGTMGRPSAIRTWSLLADLDQGLLPYLPLLVLGAAAGLARMAYTRNARGLLLAAGGVGMAAGVQLAPNWNSDCAGLMRYLVWMLPVVAGVAVWGIGGRVRLWAFAAVAVVAHALIWYGFDRSDILRDGYVGNNAVARWVLQNYPRAYWPEPEIFIERQRHVDGWPHDTRDFPVGHVLPDGTVNKLILDAGSVDRVAERYAVDPGYLLVLREQAAGERGLFYAHPPAGAVRTR